MICRTNEKFHAKKTMKKKKKCDPAFNQKLVCAPAAVDVDEQQANIEVSVNLDDAFHLSSEHQADLEQETLYKASGSLTPPGEMDKGIRRLPKIHVAMNSTEWHDAICRV
jgi:hypothetical protein